MKKTAIRFSIGFVLVLCIWIASGFSTKGDPDTVQDNKEVMAVIHQFFEGMKTQDTATLQEIILSGSQFYAYIETDSAGLIHRSSHENWMENLVNKDKSFVERIWDAQVKVHKGIATVWTPYDFYINGEYAHCGVNSFQLVKSAKGWKIADTVFTIEKDCGESPLGPFELEK